MNDIVLIGKVTGSTPNLIEMEYPSTMGINSVRLPRTMVNRFERISNGRVAVYVRTDESEKGRQLDDELVNKHAPLHVTGEHMSIVMAFENNEPIEVAEEFDDETPIWSAPSEVAPTITVDGVVQASGPFDEMLFAGGRKEKATMDWDFDPVRKPAFVLVEDEDNGMGATIAKVTNADGKPSAYHIFNPNYASDARPMGAHLGTFSASYYPMPYRVGYGPVLDMAAEKGWPTQVMAWNEGKQSALFIDVSSNVDWEKASGRLGTSWQARGFANNGDYRVGIAIYNSLDGSSAYKVQAIAERLVCTNGMVMGDRANLISLRHTNGVLGNFDFSKLADKIHEVIETAAEEIIVAETMRDFTVNRDTFEKLMTICERKGLITKPQIKRDDTGNVVGVNRGHMWRLMGQGWTNPSEPWVAVNNQDKGSLLHVYNILTGAITHKPTWTDGKDTLTGSTLNFSTLTDRLQTVHKVLGDMTRKAVNGKSIDEQLEKVPMFSEILY